MLRTGLASAQLLDMPSESRNLVRIIKKYYLLAPVTTLQFLSELYGIYQKTVMMGDIGMRSVVLEEVSAYAVDHNGSTSSTPQWSIM